MTGDKEKVQRLVALFLAGGVFFSYPIISLFNLQVFVFGIPLLYLFIFVIWLVLILLIGLATRSGSRGAGKRSLG